MTLKKIWPLLVMMGSMSMLIACSPVRPVVYVTGSDYIRLRSGQTFTAPRDMTLATEAVIQKKDEQILDLLRANTLLQTENTNLKGR